MPAVAIGITLAATAWSAYSQHKAGQAQQTADVAQGNAALEIGLATQRSDESEAQLSEYNAQVAQLQATDAEQRGELDANRFRTQVKQVIGSQRVGFAAGNIDAGFGSAVDVQSDAAFLGELDALTIRTNAAREAWGYKVQAEDLRRAAAIKRQEGANAAQAGRLGQMTGVAAGKTAATQGNVAAVGTVLTNTSSLLLARYGYK